jgi:type II secretory pathway component PulM
MSALADYWNRMANRERLGVVVAVVAVLLAALLLGVVEPSMRAVRSNLDELPQLAAQRAEVETLAGIAAARGTQQAASAEALKQTAAGLGVTLDISGEGPFVAKFQASAFPSLMQFVAQARRSYGVTVREAHVEKASPGLVAGQITLNK